MYDLYGIPNCDTMKKARNWLKQHEIEYTFHDYKKEGVDQTLLRDWVEKVGWELLLNRRGLSWRRLPAEKREGVDCDRAIALMLDNPSMIKRPVLVSADQIEVGFSEERYSSIFQ